MAKQVYVEEAKACGKVCPQRVPDMETEIADGLRISRPRNEAYCVGARCMMWRWGDAHINNPAGGDMIFSQNTHGFCGLAGRPS